MLEVSRTVGFGGIAALSGEAAGSVRDVTGGGDGGFLTSWPATDSEAFMGAGAGVLPLGAGLASAGALTGVCGDFAPVMGATAVGALICHIPKDEAVKVVAEV